MSRSHHNRRTPGETGKGFCPEARHGGDASILRRFGTRGREQSARLSAEFAWFHAKASAKCRQRSSTKFPCAIAAFRRCDHRRSVLQTRTQAAHERGPVVCRKPLGSLLVRRPPHHAENSGAVSGRPPKCSMKAARTRKEREPSAIRSAYCHVMLTSVYVP